MFTSCISQYFPAILFANFCAIGLHRRYHQSIIITMPTRFVFNEHITHSELSVPAIAHNARSKYDDLQVLEMLRFVETRPLCEALAVDIFTTRCQHSLPAHTEDNNLASVNYCQVRHSRVVSALLHLKLTIMKKLEGTQT